MGLEAKNESSEMKKGIFGYKNWSSKSMWKIIRFILDCEKKTITTISYQPEQKMSAAKLSRERTREGGEEGKKEEEAAIHFYSA